MEWYYIKDDEKIGPIAELEIEKYINSNKVRRETLIWFSELDDWIPAIENRYFSNFFSSTPPPLPKSQKTDKTLWGTFKPFAIIIVIFILFIIGNIIYKFIDTGQNFFNRVIQANEQTVSNYNTKKNYIKEVIRVWDLYVDWSSKMFIKDAKKEDIENGIKTFESLDLTGCPNNFRNAFIEYTATIRPFFFYSKKMEGLIFKNEALEKHYNEAFSQIKKAEINLKTEAMKSGLRFED